MAMVSSSIQRSKQSYTGTFCVSGLLGVDLYSHTPNRQTMPTILFRRPLCKGKLYIQIMPSAACNVKAVVLSFMIL